MRAAAATILLALLASCGGDDGSADCQATCADLGVTCGAFTNTCGVVVDCGACRYSGEAVGGGLDPVLADTATPMIAFGTGNAGVRVATRGATGWTTEMVTATGSIDRVDFAVMGDTRYVAFTDFNVGSLATSVAGGAWTVEQLPGGPKSLALAFDGTGALVIAGVGSDATTQQGVLIYTRTGATWTVQRIADATSLAPATVVEIAFVGGERHVFWAQNGTLYERVDDAPAVELGMMSQSAAELRANSLDTAIDSKGKLHLLYESGGGAIHQVLDGGVWTADPIAPSYRQGSNALVLDSGDRVIAAYYTNSALELAELRGGAWAHQTISGECDDGAVDLSLGPGDEVRMVRSCGDAVTYLVRGELYPADYATTCAQLVTTTCTKACDCASGMPDTSCCLRSGGSTYCTGDVGCQSNFNAVLCGDATQDPADVYACAAEIGAAACFADDVDASWGLEVDAATACGRLAAE